MAEGFISHIGRHVGGLANPPADPTPTAGYRSFWGFWFGGMAVESGVTPTPTPAGLAHRRRWTVIPWDEDFYRDLVRERRQAKEEIRRLVAKKQKLERTAARKSKKIAAGPALIGAQADMLALLGRLEDARSRALEAEMAMAAWKAQRDDDDFLDMMVMM